MFRKKEVEEIPEPLTLKDINKIKESLSETETKNLSIRDLDILEIVPQSFKYGIINIIDNKHALFLEENVNSDKYKTFNKSVAGRFNSDVVKYINKKNPGQYVLIEGKNDKKIVRLIEDEELLLYQTLKLIDGIIKDKPYMLIKSLDVNDKLTSSNRWAKEINSDMLDEESILMNINPVLPTEEDDNHESITSSISLFDE